MSIKDSFVFVVQTLKTIQGNFSTTKSVTDTVPTVNASAKKIARHMSGVTATLEEEEDDPNLVPKTFREKHPQIMKVYDGVTSLAKKVIDFVGGTTFCRLFFIASSAALFVGSVGMIPAGIAAATCALAVCSNIAFETSKLQKLRDLNQQLGCGKEYKNDNTKLNNFIHANPELKKHSALQDFFAEKAKTFNGPFATPEVKKTLWERFKEKIPRVIHNVAKTLRDNGGEASAYLGISLITGNIVGAVFAGISYMFGSSTSVIERHNYENKKTDLRKQISEYEANMPPAHSKYEALRQQKIELETQKNLLIDQDFQTALAHNNKSAMEKRYQKLRAEVTSYYPPEQKSGFFTKVADYFKDVWAVLKKGTDASMDIMTYVEKNYDSTPKIARIESNAVVEQTLAPKAKEHTKPKKDHKHHDAKTHHSSSKESDHHTTKKPKKISRDSHPELHEQLKDVDIHHKPTANHGSHHHHKLPRHTQLKKADKTLSGS